MGTACGKVLRQVSETEESAKLDHRNPEEE